MKIKKCRICKNTKLKIIFSLGKQPLANNLVSSASERSKTYPLELVQCNHCSLIQLSYVIPKEKMFDKYFYIPSVAQTYIAHFEELSESLITSQALKKSDLVVDIGGSDGSLLSSFEKRGMRVLNVEPAKNIKSKVDKINRYFTPKTANEVVKKYGKAKLVTATNVFAHIHNLHEFIKCLDILLDKDGVFFAQFPDVRYLLRENQFDTIYHEHLSYFTYEPLHHLFSRSPFELFKVDNSEIHGGSMRIYVRRRAPLLSTFKGNVSQIKRDLVSYLIKEKKNGKSIAAFGAAAKGMTLLYYCGLDNKTIDFIADGTPYKQGKYSPGTLIKIVPEQTLLETKPDIILILAWNYKEEIIKKVREMYRKEKSITFVIPIPTVEIIK